MSTCASGRNDVTPPLNVSAAIPSLAFSTLADTVKVVRGNLYDLSIIKNYSVSESCVILRPLWYII